jgi:hypothetical protein
MKDINGECEEGGIQQNERMVSIRSLPSSYCVVVADGQVVYEGTDQMCVSEAFFRAGKGGAKVVECFVNGVKVTHSRAVIGA